MKKYLFLLSATMFMLALTACGGNDETTIPPTEQEFYNGQEAENSTSETQAGIENSNNEIITVRFYYHSPEIDPQAYSLPEAFLYESVDIPAANFEEVFVSEFYERTGIPIMGIWFQNRFEDRFEDRNRGGRLFVNLHNDAIRHFDSRGTAGSAIELNILQRTLLSIPGIISYEVLVDWQRGIMGNHFSFNHVAYVENGEVVERVWFNLNTPDDDTTLPGSSNGMVFADGVVLPARLFTAAGATQPTHIPFLREIVDIFGWEVINTGMQSGIFRDGESVAGIIYVNYEYHMFNYLHRFDVGSIGVDDAFISPNNNSYLLISLFRDTEYRVYFANGNVHISPPPAMREWAGATELTNTSNPFAAPLLEFFAAGAASHPSSLPMTTRSFSVLLDDASIQGVLAIQAGYDESGAYTDAIGIIFYYWHPTQTILFLDLGWVGGVPWTAALTENNLPILFFEDYYGVATAHGEGRGGEAYVLFDIVDGVLTEIFTLERRDEFHGRMYFPDGRNPHNFIFDEAMSTFGFDTAVSWRDMKDQTEEILSWVFFE